MDEGEQALSKLYQHIEITGISLKMNPPLKPSDNLRAIVKQPTSEKSQKPQKPQAPSKSQTEFLWCYKLPILLFPKDELRITVEISKPKKLKLLSAPPIPSTLTFKYESLLQGDGVQEIEDKGTLIVERRPGTKLTLDSLARFEASSGAEALTKGLSQLHTLFKFIAEKSEILDSIIAFTTTTAQVNPSIYDICLDPSYSSGSGIAYHASLHGKMKLAVTVTILIYPLETASEEGS
ncbi:hypothetical protein M422DRAFT_65137 [Sphaerobolus stellatus SS14]|nr:hypothetical protein M422DRAFT_65137 [Sphaerobolus stellatus SS14]